MQEVADEAGVSLGTVSNYLNRPLRVAAPTRGRVRDAIDRLGYIRNAPARDLKRRQSDGIGLIVPDIQNRLFIDIAQGAQSVARQEGRKLVLANAAYRFESFSPLTVDHQQDEFLDYFAEERMGGILYAAMSDPTRKLEHIRGYVRPIVVLNYDQQGDWCSVLLDNRQAGRLGVEHLVASGAQKLYYLSPPDAAQPLVERRRGVRDAAARASTRLEEVIASGLLVEDGEMAAQKIISRLPTGESIGVLAATDQLAIGALRALRTQTELHVPSDLMVMGLDGSHTEGHSDWIRLTSIQTPGELMGCEAMRLVLEEAQPGHRHERVVLPVSVVARESTLPSPFRRGANVSRPRSRS